MTVYSTFEYFNTLLSHPDTFEVARKQPNFFIKKSKLGLTGLLRFLLSRKGYTVTNEINHYYSSIDKLEDSVSKQAIFQAQDKLRYQVFPYLNSKLCKYFYQNNEFYTLKDYVVVAFDGSVCEAPYNEDTAKVFSLNRDEKKDIIGKTCPRISGCYDVLNGLYLDVLIGSYKDAELPMAYQQMENIYEILNEQNIIFLADRNYDASDLFVYFNMKGDKFCFRGKSYVYKKLASKVEKDGWIEVELTDQWINRFKIEEVKEYAKANNKLRIRVIKYMKSEVKKLKEDEKDEEIILFTNLEDSEWSRDDLICLYNGRWHCETGYDTLKNKIEMERVTSEKPENILQEFHSQVVVHNLASIVKQESDKIVKHTEKYQYQTNINNLIQLIKANIAVLLNFNDRLRCKLDKIIVKAARNKEPIRPGRYFKRWNVVINKPSTCKFRVDGKRNPHMRRIYGKCIRVNR